MIETTDWKWMDFYFSLTLIRLPPNRPSLRVEREKRVSQYTNEKITGTITDEQILKWENRKWLKVAVKLAGSENLNFGDNRFLNAYLIFKRMWYFLNQHLLKFVNLI